MKNNYVLIDYENVQPKNLAMLNGHKFKVLIFVGATQARFPFELAAAVQALGSDAEYVKIDAIVHSLVARSGATAQDQVRARISPSADLTRARIR